MKNKALFFVLLAVGIALILLGAVPLLFTVATMIFRTAPAEIGIIGGADGPTALFLVKNVFSTPLLLLISGIVCVAIAVIVRIKK